MHTCMQRTAQQIDYGYSDSLRGLRTLQAAQFEHSAGSPIQSLPSLYLVVPVISALGCPSVGSLSTLPLKELPAYVRHGRTKQRLFVSGVYISQLGIWPSLDSACLQLVASTAEHVHAKESPVAATLSCGTFRKQLPSSMCFSGVSVLLGFPWLRTHCSTSRELGLTSRVLARGHLSKAALLLLRTGIFGRCKLLFVDKVPSIKKNLPSLDRLPSPPASVSEVFRVVCRCVSSRVTGALSLLRRSSSSRASP